MLIDRISPFFLDFGDLEMGGGRSPLISGMRAVDLLYEDVTGWIELIRYSLALAWLGWEIGD